MCFSKIDKRRKERRHLDMRALADEDGEVLEARKGRCVVALRGVCGGGGSAVDAGVP